MIIILRWSSCCSDLRAQSGGRVSSKTSVWIKLFYWGAILLFIIINIFANVIIRDKCQPYLKMTLVSVLSNISIWPIINNVDCMTSYVRYKPANIFFALVWHWAASLSKNELDKIFSNTVGANIKDSTTTISTTIHIKRNSKSIFLQKNWPQIPKMRVLGLHIISQRAWPLMRPNFVRITCSQYKYALTLTRRNSRGARNPLSIKGLRRLWQVWRGRRFCSTDQPLLLMGPPRHRPIHRLRLPFSKWSWSFSSWTHIS